MDRLFLKLPIWEWLRKNHHRLWVRQVPNALTVLRLILAWPVSNQLYHSLASYNHGSGAMDVVVGISAVMVLFISDGFDGTWAHQVGCVSGFGKLVDPIADKVLVGSVLGNLCWAAFDLLPGSLAWAVVRMIGVLLILEVTLSIIAILEKAKHRNPKAEKWGKRKLATEGGVVFALVAGLWMVAAGVRTPGLLVVTGTLAALVAAMYLAIRSIWTHLANLAGHRSS